MSSHSKTIEKIRTGWNRINASICKYLRKHSDGCEIRKWSEFRFFHEGDLLHAEMSNPVILWNWPYRGSSKRLARKFHIVIYGRFSCRTGAEGEIELLSYGTQIGYFMPKKCSEPRIVIPIDGYHFDMEQITQRAHPVFHVQRNEKVLCEKLGSVDLTLDGDPPDRALRHIRFPTPQIDLVSALIMVIADHIVCDEETENGFFDLVQKARDLMPLKANLQRQARLKRCISQQEMLLDHWYAPTGA